MAAEDSGGPGADRASHEAKRENSASVPPLVPPGATPLFVGGLWVVRQPHWRDAVDLGTAPRHVVYAAGVEDGAQLAVDQLRDMASLLVDRLSLEQAFERAQRRYRRSA